MIAQLIKTVELRSGSMGAEEEPSEAIDEEPDAEGKEVFVLTASMGAGSSVGFEFSTIHTVAATKQQDPSEIPRVVTKLPNKTRILAFICRS